MRAKHLSLLAIMMVTMLGCNRKPSVVQSFMSSAEADTLSEHIYEHGIPIDMYSVEEGVVENGDYFSVIMEKLGVPQTTTNDLISATRKVFDVKDLRVGNSFVVDDVIRGYVAEIQDFCEAVAYDREAKADFALAKNVTLAMYAAYKAAEEGKRTEI